MQLYQKQEIFSRFFVAFVNLDSILNIIDNKDDPHSWCIFELTGSDRRG